MAQLRLHHFSPSLYLTTKSGDIKVCRVKERKWTGTTQCRAGIIPYTVINGHFIFGLGRDRASRMLTDFGGWIRWKEFETTPVAALREFTEETLGVFGKFSETEIGNSVMIYDQKMAIVFLHLEFFPSFISYRFAIVHQEKTILHDTRMKDSHLSHHHERYRLPEISEIVWTSTETIESALKRRMIYYPVGRFLAELHRFKEML